METVEVTSSLDSKLLFGTTLVYVLILLPLLKGLSVIGEYYSYITIGLGVITILFLLVILNHLSVESNTPIAYSFIIFGSILIIYGLYDVTFSVGIYAGGISIVWGIILRLTMIEILLGNLFTDFYRTVIYIVKSPIEVLSFLLQISSFVFLMIYLSESGFTGYPGTISLGLSLLVLVLVKMLLPHRTSYEKVLIFMQIFNVLMSFTNANQFFLGHLGILISYLPPAEAWVDFRRALLKYVSSLRNFLIKSNTILGISGIVFMTLSFSYSAFSDLQRMSVFLFGVVIFSHSIRSFLSPLLGFLHYYLILPVYLFIVNLNLDLILRLLSLTIFLWDIFGNLPSDFYLRVIQLPSLSFFFLIISYPIVRKSFMPYVRKLLQTKSGTLQLVSYMFLLIAFINYPFPQFTLYFFLTGIFLNLISRPIIVRIITYNVRWIARNILYLTGWLISSLLIIIGFIIALAPEGGNSFTQLAGGISGPTQIVVGIGLIMAGSVFFKEVYQRRSKEVL